MIPNLTFNDPWQLGPYTLLMLFMVLLAAIYTHSFYGMVRLSHKLPIPKHFRPMIGAFLTGLTAFVLYYAFGRDQKVLAVLAFGYNAIQNVLNDGSKTTVLLLLSIALGKILTTGLTIGSGGSGGVFGPSMVIGGCGGGALGLLFHQYWPHLVPQPASFVVVGMAGFFAAAAKTPFSTLIIVSEMTGGYELLLPALWVCTLSYMLSDRSSIYISQVESRSRSPAHQGSYVRDVLAGVQVGRIVAPQDAIPHVHPGDSLTQVVGEFDRCSFSVLPVVNDELRLLGVVDLEELHLASQAIHAQPLILVTDMMRTDVRPLQMEDQLDQALELFIENDLLALPIVDDDQHRRVVGMVRRFEIASAYIKYVHGPSATEEPPLEKMV